MTATVPAVGAPERPRLPSVAELTLPSGLRVLAVNRGDVPRLEVRLRMPIATGRSGGDGSKERILAEALTAGTATRTSVQIAEELQRLGANLRASVNPEELVLSGSTLMAGSRQFFDLLADILTDAAFDDEEVSVAEGRAAQEVVILRSQPTVIAQESLLRRLYGKHHYGRGLPDADALRAVTPHALKRLHKSRVSPKSAVLVLVGSFDPERILDEAADALGGWKAEGRAAQLRAPNEPTPAPTLLVDRPGSVQTNIRLGGPVVGRDHPDHARLQVANMIFGGYVSSRLVGNIREDKGFSYSPRSSVNHRQLASYITVAAEVATDVTVPALNEIRYELTRMASSAVTAAELAAAQRYLVGTLALATQTQSGLATWLSALTSSGLGADFLEEYPRQVEQVSVDDVAYASQHYLAPRSLNTVLVGAADQIREQVETLDEVEVVSANAG